MGVSIGVEILLKREFSVLVYVSNFEDIVDAFLDPLIGCDFCDVSLTRFDDRFEQQPVLEGRIFDHELAQCKRELG